MNRLDTGVAEKIRLVQGEDVDESIRLHDGGETGVMHLHPAHPKGSHQPAPDRINPIIVWKKRHRSFHFFDASLGFSYGEAIAVSLRRTSTNVSELGDILQGEVQARALPVYIFQNRFDHQM
jgi:hypothetical protein